MAKLLTNRQTDSQRGEGISVGVQKSVLPIPPSRWDFSARGLGRVAAITVLGTLLCIAVPVVVDVFIIRPAPLPWHQELWTDFIIPVVLAVPLLLVLSLKMRALAIAHAQLQVIASTDSLTAVLNRGAFTLLVDAYLGEVREQERAGALLIVDDDHFKCINDELGHDRGDEALQAIARSIKGLVRSADLVGRVGGEEFGVFLPGSDPRQAEAVAERIRQTVNEIDFRADGERRELSVSVGGAIFAGEVNYEDLYHLADQQLYRAKQAGRNRVVVARMPRRLAA
jgi:diguanylate cyclase (GGDEF)-like protein